MTKLECKVSSAVQGACSSPLPNGVHFLGVGAASSLHLGNAACVLTRNSRPWLLIDCGFDTVGRFKRAYQGALPSAIFITHLHFDHIGGLEQLYFQAALKHVEVDLYVPVTLIYELVNIFASTELAEGNYPIWQVFRLKPVVGAFWHKGVMLYCHEVRHHKPKKAFGLHLPGLFFYSGDTRPIPELLNHCVNGGEIIFHDCGLEANPSHTGASELFGYPDRIFTRIRVYHYHDTQDVHKFAEMGIRAVLQGERIPLGE